MLKNKTKTSNEQTEANYCYKAFKVELLQNESIKGTYEKTMKWLTVESKSMADLYNHLKQNVIAVALEILGKRSRNVTIRTN